MKKQVAEVGSSGARFWWLVFAEEFFAILDEADEHDNGRPRQADKKHDFQNSHCKDCYLHTQIVACLRFIHRIFAEMKSALVRSSHPSARCDTLGAGCSTHFGSREAGSCGPRPVFPPACLSCRFRWPGRCPFGGRSSHGLRWFRCCGRCFHRPV